jgi:threonine/homoserine/homoserine lactone efflux protein
LSLGELFAIAFVTALSGALMPGPVLFVAVRHSAAGRRWVGPLIVLGHAIVEVPLMLAIIFGLGELLTAPGFVGAIGLAGGTVLLAMAGSMLRSLPRLRLPKADEVGPAAGSGSLSVVLAGAATSVSNPYFTIWWATVGITFLAKAAPYAAAGYATFYAGHVLADLAWYGFVGETVRRGRRVLTDGAYRWLVDVLAGCLAGFGAWFVLAGVSRLGGT